MNIYWKRILDFLTGKIPTLDSEALSVDNNTTEAQQAARQTGTEAQQGAELKDNTAQQAEAQSEPEQEPEAERESCPIATRRLIREAMQQLRNFSDEHRLTATVARALLAILAEIAVSALQGRVNTQVLEVIKKVIRHEEARLFDYSDTKTHTDAKTEANATTQADAEAEAYAETEADAEPQAQIPADDGLPHFFNTPFASRQSFFQLADEARL